VRCIKEDSIRIHGFTPLSKSRIAALLAAGSPMSDAPGDFVVSGHGEDAHGSFEVVASSAIGFHNYYCCDTPARFKHGPNLFQVAASAELPWRWNERAVASLLAAGYTVGDDTLHPAIRRFPAATEVIVRAGLARHKSYGYWSGVFDRSLPRVSCEDASDELARAIDDVSHRRLALSLSSGFDSRAILSMLLARGIRPVVGTMGFPESTDMIVASAIAKRFALEHHRVRLNSQHYLLYAKQITELTGGTKPAEHWHTYLYIRSVGFPGDCLHLAGSNGEFARTYWLDRYPLALIADSMPWNIVGTVIRRRFKAGPYLPRLREALHLWPSSARGNILESLPRYFVDLCKLHLHGLDRLDEFYVMNRLRHFIGNGITLYSNRYPTFSPFLDSRWMALAARLPRSFRLRSNFHRHVIARWQPELLSFPIGAEANVRPRAGWKLRADRRADVPYSSFEDVSHHPGIFALLESSAHLLDLFPRAKLRDALTNGTLLGALMALHFAGEAARDYHR
jgi:hypothetical protein